MNTNTNNNNNNDPRDRLHLHRLQHALSCVSGMKEATTP